MNKIKKFAQKIFKNKKQEDARNGLYASLDELMDMRKYVGYLQKSRKLKSYSENSGDISSLFKGRGIEMEEIREYGFGDDVRDIDWRVTARKEKPYTKVYQEERDHEIYVWLDLSSIMLFGSRKELKSVTSSKLAALLGWIALNNKDKFGCVIFDGQQSWMFKPKHDRAYLAAILKKITEISQMSLSSAYNDEEKRIKSLKLLQSNVKNKAGIFVITSFGYWSNACDIELTGLAKKTKMYMINVFDQLEEKAPSSGQYMAEYNGEKLVFDSSSKTYRKDYAMYFAKKREEKESFCRRFGCKMISFSSDMSYGSWAKIL